MPQFRVDSFTISLDGFGAGPHQDLAHPLGVGGTALHGWAMGTRTFQKHLFGNDGGQDGVDDDFAARGFRNVGAWIMGRNMFGPVRGPWPDESWRGWWGENPVYHVPVFVLTTMRAHRWSWRAAPPSTLSPTASTPRWPGPARRRRAGTCVWAAASALFSSTCASAWWTRCTSRSRPCCWAPASGCSRG